jgi:hypothetical protein
VPTNSWLSAAHLFLISLCTPDLVPVGLFLFPCLKSIMNGARLADMAAIQECATAVLRLIPKQALADRSFLNVANSVL